MTRTIAVLRVLLYAGVAALAATTPDVARTIALLAPEGATSVPQLDGNAPATLGWLSTGVATLLWHAAGYAGLIFATAASSIATLALVEWRARRKASAPVAFAATVLCALCLLDVAHVGGGVGNAFFLALLLLAFEAPGRFAPFASAAVTALWCNANAAGVLAPAFACAVALGAGVDRDEKVARDRAALAALLVAAATLATPAFAAFPMTAWRALGFDGALGDLLPVAPSVIAPLAYHAGIVATIVVALVIGGRASRSGDTLVFVVGALLAFASGAFVPFAGIAGASVVAEAAMRIRRGSGAGPAGPVRFFGSALAAAFVLGTSAASFGASHARLHPSEVPPFGALAKYARLDSAHRSRMVCARLTWCDVAERRYGIAVLADSRASNAPVETIAAQTTIAGARAGWRARARSFGVDAIFASTHSGFTTLLIADRWQPYAVDGPGTIFVRTGDTR